MTTNYWHVLGVDPTATDDQIKSAYRRHAAAWHPDVNKSPQAEERFKLVAEAYETLRDPNLRVEHTYALARIAAADAPTDAVDAALAYGKPKKKKKKKKKKVAVVELSPQCAPPAPPPIPAWYYDQRRGRADYEGIPDGFETGLNDIIPGSRSPF